MQQPEREDLKECWIRRARQLDKEGRFRLYTPRQRAEVLRKGFLGKWPPDMAIKIARSEVKAGRHWRTPRFNDQMRDHYHVVDEDVRNILLKLCEEVPPECYEPPAELRDPPGYPFIFHSKILRDKVYLKFQLLGTGKKIQVLFWSCHPSQM